MTTTDSTATHADCLARLNETMFAAGHNGSHDHLMDVLHDAALDQLQQCCGELALGDLKAEQELRAILSFKEGFWSSCTAQVRCDLVERVMQAVYDATGASATTPSVRTSPIWRWPSPQTPVCSGRRTAPRVGCSSACSRRTIPCGSASSGPDPSAPIWRLMRSAGCGWQSDFNGTVHAVSQSTLWL